MGAFEMIQRLPATAPRVPRTRGRRYGLGQSSGGSLLTSIGSDLWEMTDPWAYWEYAAAMPSNTSISDFLANALGKPLTQNEINGITAQTQQQVVQACGPGNQNSLSCQTAVQQAATDINAAAQQSNQELAGFPYSAVQNLTWPSLPSLPSLSSIPTWVWIALGGVGIFLIYEMVS